ncbi:MAG: hypothetical protein ACN4GZ_20005 [Acidimicrobiales bacterium]
MSEHTQPPADIDNPAECRDEVSAQSQALAELMERPPSYLEWISPKNLIATIDHRVGPGLTELSCHPSYVDLVLDSPYHTQSDLELCNYDDLHMTVRIE